MRPRKHSSEFNQRTKGTGKGGKHAARATLCVSSQVGPAASAAAGPPDRGAARRSAAAASLVDAHI